MGDVLQALTLMCPWAHAIAYWGKNIENRTWTPPRSLIGQCIAIHAGKSALERVGVSTRAPDGWKWRSGAARDETQAAFEFIASARGPTEPFRCQWLHDTSSAVLAVATIAGYVDETGDEWGANGRAPADLDAVNAARRVRSPWFVGPYGWVLRAVVAIDPVPCKGRQGLWRLPPNVNAEVLRRVEQARSAA